MGAKACTAKWRNTTSSANSAPAIGALKLAETAAATAQPRRSRPVMPSDFSRVFTAVAISAARCTTGPSRPDEPPVDSVTKFEIADPIPRRSGKRPSRSAAPSITSATVSTRPSLVVQCSTRPTISPPPIGTASTHHQSSPAATLCSRVISSVP